jgi:peptidoglycan/xylan/chitin deacetylase (PgdA/CDA1 family)
MENKNIGPKLDYFFENYSDILKFQKTSLRSIIRHTVLNTISTISSFRNTRKILQIPRIQFLYIHHIFKDEEENLVQLLNFLKRDHIFISYSDAILKIINNEIDAPYICLSSDDGFKNNLSAARIFKQFGISACFFINPEFTKHASSFEKSKEFCQNKLNLPPVEFMNWNDIQTLINLGHEIGLHTLSHDNVATLTDSDFENDCLKSQQIMQKTNINVKHFAWPYGRFFHFGESKKNIVFNLGFKSCASAERGCHTNLNTDNYQDLIIRRDHIVLDWPLRHIEFFLIQNARKMHKINNFFPHATK